VNSDLVSTGMGTKFSSWCGTFILVCDQPTQPGHPFVGRQNEYQPKGGDAVWLGSKGRLCGWKVKLCDPIVTHEPYLSNLVIKGL